MMLAQASPDRVMAGAFLGRVGLCFNVVGMNIA